MTPINRYRGTVRRVSANRAKIRVRLRDGGNIWCPNKGFEVGDEVCIIFDPPRKRVLDVKDSRVADLIVAAASNEVIQSTLHNPLPVDCELEEEFETINIATRIEGVKDEFDADIGAFCTSNGSLSEVDPDRSDDEHSGEDGFGADDTADPDIPY